jgi:hypothetical protein
MSTRSTITNGCRIISATAYFETGLSFAGKPRRQSSACASALSVAGRSGPCLGRSKPLAIWAAPCDRFDCRWFASRLCQLAPQAGEGAHPKHAHVALAAAHAFGYFRVR